MATAIGSTAQIAGSADALEVVQNLIASIGGDEIWRNAKGIEVTLEGHYVVYEEPWIEVYWLDYQTPRGRYEINSDKTNQLIGWNTEKGWKVIDGEFIVQSADEHRIEMDYYNSEPTVIFNRLAKGESGFLVSIDSSEIVSKLVIQEKESGKEICTIGYNLKFEPVYWSALINGKKYERVLGPLKGFGDGLSLFSWGADPSGRWRYLHQKIRLLDRSPRVSFEPPKISD